MSKKFQLTSKIGLIAILLFAVPLQAFAAFQDISHSNPQYEAIHALELKKVITGYPDGTFKPEKSMGRAEFLKIAFNDIGYKPEQKSYNTGFKDVPAKIWFSGYVRKALDLKLITPPQINENFQPEKPFSKIDAVRIAFALEGVPTPFVSNINQNDLFDDIRSESPIAYIALAAKKNGIISSKNPRLFTPLKSLTRGDSAELLYQTDLIQQESSAQDKITLTPSKQNLDGADDLSSKFLSNPKFSILLDIWKKAKTNYYYPEKLSDDELLYGAIQGLVNKMGDPYTVFQEPVDAAELSDFLQGELQGIGIQIDTLDEKLVILKTLPNSPAEKAGIKLGDIIDKIEGKSVNNMTLENVLKLIRGNVGTSVHLSVVRKGITLEFDVQREKIALSSTSSKIIAGNIAYIDINKFTATTDKEFEAELTKTITPNTHGIILDLRGNPGGYLDIADNILNHFVSSGKILVSTKTVQNIKTDFFSKGKGELAKYPIIVIMDNLTASASEILAAALQDYKIAQLVGTKSFGKGSVQKLFNYEDNSIFKMSIAHWLTPLGKDINGTGLKPDIEVEQTKTDILNGQDPQLERAVSELQKK